MSHDLTVPVLARHHCGLILALLLSGCATYPVSELPKMDDWDARNRVLAGIAEWEFRGRIGVTSSDDGFNGKLRWQQSVDNFTASVSGPIGFGSVRVAGNSAWVQLTSNDGITSLLTNPEQDLLERYGWTLPVQSLRYWALGIPDPASPATTVFAPDGLLANLEQGGWQVHYNEYQEVAGQAMPKRLSATANDVKVVVIVQNWLFK
jgi:outer membrane lipoprotein LolB